VADTCHHITGLENSLSGAYPREV